MASLTEREAATLLYDWRFWARPNQLAPAGDWVHWLVMAGRGFGKTRTGAEWVRDLVISGQARRIALVAPTAVDARQTMVEGESGLMAISPPWEKPVFNPSRRQVSWPGGAVATLFSAEEPERLRGPQHDAAWCDEVCVWRRDRETWDMLMFGLRLGRQPRTCITTTPRPTALIRMLLAHEGVAVTRGSTFDNMANLAPTFRREILARYEGTRLGRQELNAELLDDVPGALWSRALLESSRRSVPERLDRVVIALDPPASAGEQSDEAGLVAVGRAGDHAFVLADESSRGQSPLGWAKRAVDLYHAQAADRLVVEVNQGGAMVTSLIHQVDGTIPVYPVHATRGKVVRAEPVAALYERGLAHHVRPFPELEDQMCRYTGAAGQPSPDRLDALVWAMTHLMLAARPPRLRRL
ncbi:DNA-packaging protein [Yunchengibacter salinarum]|uniref:DNA-packaging protein n=1 Tax=Yunchengibacter salinarum TaxID=3133399 RepID=UPI0035B62B4A